ncbi:MAG TPA: PQQ-binding-like beta-propeller repeat protein, partial [Planctomycetaceae bacterium]|nr:PQQ-binding-like beta-propeller repeat protein [Planctomycetaceae bacterium]
MIGGHWKAIVLAGGLIGASPLWAAGLTSPVLPPGVLWLQTPEKVPDQSEPSEEEPAPAEPAPKAADEKPDAEKQADKKPADKKQVDKKPGDKKPNPLGNLLKGMFAPTPPVQGPVRGNRNSAQKTSRDRSDPRAPFDPDQAKLFRDTQSRIDEKDWPQAVRGIERLLGQSGDSLIRIKGRWRPVKAEARLLLAQLPANVLQNWKQERTAASQQALANAVRSGRPYELARVAEQYVQMPAGYEAADRLAALHFDRGEYALAAKWYGELLAADAPQSRSTGWKLRLAFAARESGDVETADQVVKGLGSSAVTAAGHAMSAQKWWAQIPQVKLALGQDLAEWPQWYGASKRTGRAIGGAPLLLSRWRQALTESAPLQTQIEDLLEDLDDQGSTLLPATFPLMVDGKLVVRTLQGVRVIDAQTGRRLWETPDEVSAERLMIASDEEEAAGMQFGPFGQVVVGFRNGVPRYVGGGAEQHALSQLLFRNANYGVLSSDRRRLFVLEDQAILSGRQPGQFIDPDASDTDSYGRSWSSNKLTAYDLQTGRSLWEIGGPSQNDPFELPLAGCFFFGPPTADQGELFVVGEKENEIRLYVLDAGTGALKWSQLLAFSEAKIEVDVVRQCWSAPVSVGGGVLICPTTVGWLVAIDRSSHDILWGQRIAPEKTRDRNAFGEDFVQITQFAESWAQAPPIIAGQRVLYTPQEDGHLYCFNLADGKKIWQRSREGLYLAGVAENRALVVAANRMMAYGLDDGSPQWSVPLGTLENRPSGRGMQVDHLYHLPLSSGELWTIDLKTGKVVSKAFPASEARPRHELGNLAVYRGMLFSVGPLGVTAYEQREAVEREIQTTLAANPADPAGNIRKAEYELLRRNATAALGALHAVAGEGLAANLAEQRRVLLLACIHEIARGDLTGHDAEFNELQGLIRTDDERREFQRLSAERALARHNPLQAFENYLALIPDSLESLPMIRDGRKSVRLDAWLAGRLGELWQNAPESIKPELDARIAAAAGAAVSSAEKQRFLAMFGFHPSATPLHLELAEAAGRAGEFLVAENMLERLRRDPQTAPAALEKLARLLSEAHLPADAAQCYRLLEDRYPHAVLASGRTAEEVVLDLRDAGEFPDEPEGPLVDWQNAELSMTRSGVNFSPSFSHDLPLQGGGWPFFRDHRMRIYPQDQRFVTLEANRESPLWSQPLRTASDNGDDSVMAADVSAHQVVLAYRGVIHCLSPVERRVLW